MRFFIQQDQTYKSYLTISNVSQGNVAYKVKTTAPRFYVVKPNQGILDRGQKITIDITLIQAPENKIDDNKFLVQVAQCELSSSETYQLQTFWDKLEKGKSISYKLKVAIAGQQSQPSAPSFGAQLQREVTARESQQPYQSTPSFKEEHVLTTDRTSGSFATQPQSQQQPQQQQQTQQQQQKPVKHEYEKAPDDEINQSQLSVSQSQNVNQDNIKRKTEEVKKQLDAVLTEKQRLQTEINDLKTQHLENDKDQQYDWQQPDNKNEFRFQLIHLLITAIICLFIGGYLGSRDTPTAIVPIVKDPKSESMDFGLYCDSCHNTFNTSDRVPLIMPCGQTVCKDCAHASQRDSFCKLCNQQQVIEDFSSLRVNQKLLLAVNHAQQIAEASANVSSQSTLNQHQHQASPSSKVYSFQAQHNSNNVSQNNITTATTIASTHPQQQNPNDISMKSGYQYFMKSPTVTTNYSGAGLQKSTAGDRDAMTAEDVFNSEKLTVTEVNNMSVIQEEQERNHNSYISSIVKSDITAVNAIRVQRDSQKVSSTSLQPSDFTRQQYLCKIHFDKVIEYFCQQCHQSVCSKCMFLHHNGHNLTQIDDALKSVKLKIDQFDQKICDAQKDNEHTGSLLSQYRQELEQLREKQQAIIDSKFKELLQKLEERKSIISKDFMHKYESALFKLNDKQKLCKEHSDELSHARDYYQLIKDKLNDEKFMKEEATIDQIEMLDKLPEYDKFINEWQGMKLKQIALAHKNTKIEYQEGQSINMKPVEVTLNNALSLIQTLQFDNQGELQPHSQVLVTNILAKSSSQFKKDFPQSVQLYNTQQHSPQQQTPSTNANKLDTSFNYPKLNTNAQLNTFNIVKPLLTQENFIANKQQQQQPLKLSIIPSGSRSRSLQQNMENGVPTSGDETQGQIISNAPVRTSQTQSMYNSKFAKMRFSRHGTQESQELCLQIEPTQIVLNNNYEPKEEQKQIPAVAVDPEAIEEQLSQKVKLLDNAIYCVGDSRYILMFDYKNSLWQKVYFDKLESDYQGTLKFMSICQISSKKREFLMTGGCNKVTKDATGQCFKFSIPQMRVFKEMQRMRQPRYGHASVYINQLVLVMGGFNHRDDEACAPNTLNSCEKYSIKENEWSPIAPMHQERAYFSACRVKEEYIYVFGGFHNYETTSSIEYYNIMLDKWTQIMVSMPLKIAKYGLAKIEENQIVIAGGLLVENSSTRSTAENSSYSMVNTVYKLDCNTMKWTKLAKLNFRRNMYSNMAVKENLQIFAIGGTVDGINEVYDIRKKKWNTCQSYTSIMGQNDLQTYALCSLSKFNDD